MAIVIDPRHVLITAAVVQITYSVHMYHGMRNTLPHVFNIFGAHIWFSLQLSLQ